MENEVVRLGLETTVIGMGFVFIVLIALWLVLEGFRYVDPCIDYITNKFKITNK